MNEVEWNGQHDFWLDGVTIRRRWDGLDELSGTYFTDSPTQISPGNFLPTPYGTFQARDVEVRFEPENTAELSVTGIGIYGTKTNRKINSSWTQNQEGFDDGSETWITIGRTAFAIGSTSSEQGGMYVSDVSFERLDPEFNYFRANVKYRGILRAKSDKIHLSTAAREMGIEDVAVNFTGGWTDPRSGDILWPRSEVKSSYVKAFNGAPSMADIPSPQFPPVSPSVFNPQMTGGATSELKWHWPNGWTIVAREAENLVGTNIWFVQETHMFNPPATF
jgi:hypothetical protein